MSKVIIVTGASRGIGAETAVALGIRGYNVVVNYREKARRAGKVCELVREAGGQAIAIGTDITAPDGPHRLVDAALETFGSINAVVLNASGGLERGSAPDYAMRLNCEAQVELARAAATRLDTGGRIVFVTSHQAHFSETHPAPAEYTPIAASKLAGERALRALTNEFDQRDISLGVVSGDMIDGTIIVRLLERRNPAAVADRRRIGPLPTVAEFAAAIADEVDSTEPSGGTRYVGGHDLAGQARPR